MGTRISTHKPPTYRGAATIRREADTKRLTSRQRGYTTRWTRYSVDFRKRNPLCAMCLARGLVVSGACVDHKVPVDGADDPLFWVETNHQTLCDPCHSEKTAREDGGFGKARKL